MPQQRHRTAVKGAAAASTRRQSSPTRPAVYQLKVTLRGTRLPVWRRIQVPGGMTLAQLHQVLQVAMGWEDSHLHQFTVGGRVYGRPDPEWEAPGARRVGDEHQVPLQALVKPCDSFTYEYDFGDDWVHGVAVERVLPGEDGVTHPICLDGGGACPPEDVGGVSGYEDFLRAVKDRRHPEHRSALRWVGKGFDPHGFPFEQVNRSLASLSR
jgi:hypothetical protein